MDTVETSKNLASSSLRICILTGQYFGWGIYGGFGSMSRALAEQLAAAGHHVQVIVPRRQDQQPVEIIKGVEVLSFSPTDIARARQLIRSSPADLFHSQDPTVLTWLAQRIHPGRIHLVTCRDPRDLDDWYIEFRYATWKRRLLTPLSYLAESGSLVRRAVRKADGVFVPAFFLQKKVQRMFGLPEPAGFLPNLIDVPSVCPKKPPVPTFTFLARWDKRKRPWLFLDLARQFPEYHFIAAGQGSASAEAAFDRELRSRYRGIPNLELTGLVNRFQNPEQMHRLLSETWALVSTSAREGLPLTFLEAAAYGCSIVSAVDPDGFADRFGTRVVGEDFAGAIRALVASSPAEKGAAARTYVLEHYEKERALQTHVEVYRRYVSS
jgi:glycosyltransferase involved in cell wall biosynthesis